VGKSCLTNLIALYAVMTGLVEAESAVDVVYVDFDKAFDTVFHNILKKLMKYRLGKWAVRCSENWLYCWAQAGGQSPVVYPRGQYCDQYCLPSSLMTWTIVQS